MGLAFERAGLLTEAETAMRLARQFAPDNPGIAFNLANVARKLGRSAEAETLYREVIARDPQAVAPRENLAALLIDDWRLVEARSLLRRAEALAPHDAAASFNLANAERMAGDLPAAIAAYERAIAKAPDRADAHFNLRFRGRCSPAIGRAAGRNSRGGGRRPRRNPSPAASISRAGRAKTARAARCCCAPNRGLGRCDPIRALRRACRRARLARDGRSAGDAVARPRAHGPGIDALVAQGDALPAFDAEAPMLDLPGILGTTPKPYPPTFPYVAPDPARAAAWAAKLGPKRGARIGLVWGGNPDFPGDRWRSPGLKPLLPLLGLARIEWIGLQVGPRHGDLRDANLPGSFRDVADDLTDMGETAACLANLDAVVVSCTSVAHLAGAMGLKTHLLLSFAPDWRWMLERADTPWYPTLTLYRQALAGDWSHPVAAVMAALR